MDGDRLPFSGHFHNDRQDQRGLDPHGAQVFQVAGINNAVVNIRGIDGMTCVRRNEGTNANFLGLDVDDGALPLTQIHFPRKEGNIVCGEV